MDFSLYIHLYRDLYIRIYTSVAVLAQRERKRRKSSLLCLAQVTLSGGGVPCRKARALHHAPHQRKNEDASRKNRETPLRRERSHRLRLLLVHSLLRSLHSTLTPTGSPATGMTTRKFAIGVVVCIQTSGHVSLERQNPTSTRCSSSSPCDVIAMDSQLQSSSVHQFGNARAGTGVHGLALMKRGCL